MLLDKMNRKHSNEFLDSIKKDINLPLREIQKKYNLRDGVVIYLVHKKFKDLRQQTLRHECMTCKKIYKAHTEKSLYCSPKCQWSGYYHSNKHDIARQVKVRRENKFGWTQRWRIETHIKDNEYKEWLLSHKKPSSVLHHDRSYFGGNKFYVLKRDGFKCTQCSKTERLRVHHIDHTGGTSKANNSMENLVTLCISCHSKAHMEDRLVEMVANHIIRFKNTGLCGKINKKLEGKSCKRIKFC